MNLDLTTLKFKINKAREQLNKDKWKKEELINKIESLTENKDSLEGYFNTLNQTNILLQKLSERQRKKACKKIEDLGTFALQSIFGPKFRLMIKLANKKKPEAEIYVVSEEGGREIRNTPEDSRGGGIVDVVSLALKIVILQTYEPPINGPIILDEPGKHVSEEYINKVSEFLWEAQRRFGRQIILITHNKELANTASRRIKVVLNGGRSTISYY